MNNKIVHMAAFILLVIGGVNWLLVGAFSVDLVQVLLGVWPMLARAVYVIIGLAAIYELISHKSYCKICG